MRPASTDVVAWYAASLGNNYATPALLDLLGSPLTLNVVEQATMSLIALAVLPARRVPLPTGKVMKRAGALPIVLMGMANALTCRLFMVSLQHLDVSLCHTIRACNPCLAAGIGLLQGQRFSARRLCSLPLMLSGFAIAVTAQPSCSAVGVAAAIGSLLALSVLQHLTHHLTSDRRLHEMQTQMLQCSLCFALLLPGLFDGGKGRTLRKVVVSSPRFRWLSLLNGASDYVENVAATAACASCDPLTFSVIDMIRRLGVIVVCGMGARHNPAGLANVGGVLLVMVGALLYSVSDSSDNDG